MHTLHYIMQEPITHIMLHHVTLTCHTDHCMLTLHYMLHHATLTCLIDHHMLTLYIMLHHLTSCYTKI